MPVPWFFVVTVITTGVPAATAPGIVSADTTMSAGNFGVADASAESPLSPRMFAADTT